MGQMLSELKKLISQRTLAMAGGRKYSRTLDTDLRMASSFK